MSTEDSEQGHRSGPLGRSLETSTYRITFEEARQLLRGGNTHARWTSNKKEPNDSKGVLALERLKKDLFVPKVSPSFKFSRSEKIFALGSCFAVELEKRFWERGFRIESYATSYRRVLEFKAKARDLQGVSFVSDIFGGCFMEAAMASAAEAVRRVCGWGGTR